MSVFARSRNFCRPLVRAAALALMALLAACGNVREHNPIATWAPSPNASERRAQLIVLHYTGDASAQQSLHTLQTANSGGPVSAHYLIGGDGHIYQLVADAMRAWHAGAGSWGDITDVNSASIGIELANDGQSAFAPAQIDSLLRLLTDLTRRLRIAPAQVIGHEDFAPGRKTDPGPLFPWKQLADAGFGRWPASPLSDPPAAFDPWMALSAVGYPPVDRTAVIRSFHDHYRGAGAGAGVGVDMTLGDSVAPEEQNADALDAEDLRILFALSRLRLSPGR